MKLAQLRALAALADSGSIRGAARDLGLSQTAISRALRELERDTGARLLDRRTDGTDFTAAGRSLLAHARLALATLRKAEDEVRRLSGQAAVTARLAVTPVVGTYYIRRMIEIFHRDHPDGQIDVENGLLSTSLPRIIDGSLDLSICFAHPGDLPHEVTFRRFCDIQMRPILPPGEDPGPISWQALSERRWIVNPGKGSSDSAVLDWLAARGIRLARPPILCRSAYLLPVLAETPGTVMICPDPIWHRQMRGRGIVQAQVPDLPPPMPLGALHLRHAPLNTVILGLADTAERMARKLTG